MNAHPIDRRIAREAARWFVRLQGNASEAERAACADWRAGHADHERAWQLAERFHARLQDIPAGVGVPALDRPQLLDRRATLKLLTLLIVAAPLGVAGYRTLPWRAWSADERTAVGERRELTLPDGTRVQLNTDSALDVVFGADLRLLRLRAGEMLVTSAPDAAGRPLLVETREGTLRPVGTRFSVRQLDGETRVAVLEGAVELRPARAAQPVLLPAGQQARFSASAVETPVALHSQSSDWTHGVLRAEKMRLAEFAAELARYRPGLLRCDPAVAELRISGAFQLADTDKALAALARTLPVEIRYRTRYWVTIAARET
ncbi:Protein FecR [compost metagenome]